MNKFKFWNVLARISVGVWMLGMLVVMSSCHQVPEYCIPRDVRLPPFDFKLFIDSQDSVQLEYKISPTDSILNRKNVSAPYTIEWSSEDSVNLIELYATSHKGNYITIYFFVDDLLQDKKECYSYGHGYSASIVTIWPEFR